MPLPPTQATRLTKLWLTGPNPHDAPAFFDSLACLTGLRSLSIKGSGWANAPTLFNRRVSGGPEVCWSTLAAGQVEGQPNLLLFSLPVASPCCS